MVYETADALYSAGRLLIHLNAIRPDALDPLTRHEPRDMATSGPVRVLAQAMSSASLD